MRRWCWAMIALLEGCGGQSHPPGTDAGVDAIPDAAVDAAADAAPCVEPVAGCGCDAREPELCYDGPDGTEGQGACQIGLQVCRGGQWSICEGETVPSEEECNGIDDDCDGETDEGQLSECGDCNADCNSQCAGVACPQALLPEPDDALVASGKGAVTLPSDAELGRVRVRFDACEAGSETFWRRVTWDADLAGGSISFRARVGDTHEQLDHLEWIDLPEGDPPLDIGPTLQKAGGANGGFVMELEVTLARAAGGAEAVLRSVTVLYSCGGWFG